jgi:hypothetical protein
MMSIQGVLKGLKTELQSIQHKNSFEENKLTQKKKFQAKILRDILQEYDTTQLEKEVEYKQLDKESKSIAEKLKLMENKIKELKLEKECVLKEKIEWKRKTKIMRLETEEQIHAVEFLVRFWKIQNMKKRRLKKKRRRRKKKK